MKSYVYLLLSKKDNKTYVGSTIDIEKRLFDHNSGKCTATKYRTPLELIYHEEYVDITTARKRERFLKTKAGRKELKEIFNRILPGRQAVRQ